MSNRYQLLLLLGLITLSFSLKIFRATEEKEKDKNEEEIEEEEEEKESKVKPPKFSRVSGFYPEEFKLRIQSEENTKIYYTLDSTDPTTSETSQEYKDYILIYDRTSEPNDISTLVEDEQSPVSISRDTRYKPPDYPVDKAMVVRAVSKNEEGEYSPVVTKVFFVADGDLRKYEDLTVISLVTPPESLIDPDTGIYITGTMYQEWKLTDDFDPTMKKWDTRTRVNYYMKGSEWERRASLTIFDKGQACVQQDVGIRIKGRASRNYAQKSFNLNARKKYGKKTIKTDFLKNNFDINGNLITSYKSLAIRSVYDNNRMKDKIARDFFFPIKDLTSADMEPAVLFLNGEYWGFYCIQENFNDDFVSKNYLIPRNNVALAKGNEIEEGPEEEIQNFISFCEEYTKKDVADEEVYQEIKNYVDIDSMIEFFATGLYIEDTDWPGNNDGVWRNFGEKIEGNKFGDGKWRFIIFDFDLSMSPKRNSGGNGGMGNFNPNGGNGGMVNFPNDGNWGMGNFPNGGNWGIGNFNPNGVNWGMGNFNPNGGNAGMGNIPIGGNGGWGGSQSRKSIFENVVKRYDRSQINPFFITLLKNNTDFQQKFINKYCDFANEIFKPSRVNQILEKYRKDYPELVADSMVRWNMRRFKSKEEGFSSSRSSFLKTVDSIETFFSDRANYTLQNMIDFIGIEAKLVDLNIEIIGKGKIQVNSIIPTFNGNKWTGKYVTKIPITIKAIPDVGYNFKEWGGLIESDRQCEEIKLLGNSKITVYFD